MDEVSRLLAERERGRPTLTFGVVLALLLHGGLAAAVLAAARLEARRPARLPAVNVRMVTLPGEPAAAPGRPAAEPAPPVASPAPPQPQPTAAPRPQPTARPQPRPTAAPQRPVPDAEADRPAPSERAMPAADATPVPADPAPAPAGGSPGGAGTGGGSSRLSLGEGAGGGTPGVPSDFQFTYYVDRMLALIEQGWYRPPAPAGTRARVQFTILRSGHVTDIALEASSGVPSFDRAALRALYAANPLPPLPQGYRRDALTIHLTFSESP